MHALRTAQWIKRDLGRRDYPVFVVPRKARAAGDGIQQTILHALKWQRAIRCASTDFSELSQIFSHRNINVLASAIRETLFFPITSPRLIAVDLEWQLLPGAFEQALNHLVEHKQDLIGVDAYYQNGLTYPTSYQETPESEVGRVRE